jgi:hypothetical protein
MRIDGSSLAPAATPTVWREHPAPLSVVLTRHPPPPSAVVPTAHHKGRGGRCGEHGDDDEDDNRTDTTTDPRLLVMKLLLEKLTGRRVDTLDPDDFRVRAKPVDLTTPPSVTVAYVGEARPSGAAPRIDVAL